MRFEYRSTCFLAVGLLLASCGSGRTDGGVDDPAAPPAITAIDVPPFRVHGDGTREEVAAQALRIETVAALLQRDLFEQAPGPTVDIWLFTDADSTARYTREVFGREPEPAEGFYSPGERAIVVDLSARDGGVEHFVVHAFVQAGFERCPVWLDEGLAQYMEAALTGKPGELVIVPGRRDKGGFATHAKAKKPYRLNRVLNFQSDDFHASTKQHLKYAQAYTLVTFSLHGGQGAYRDGFFTYLRSAYAGKDSSTHFKKAIGVKEKELEKAWAEYVRGA